jgi:hypothetical protein
MSENLPWTVMERSIEDAPAMLRVCEAWEGLLERKPWLLRLWATWDAVQESGLPEEASYEQLLAVEDVIAAEAEKTGVALLAVLTTQGRSAWYLAARDEPGAGRAAKTLIEKVQKATRVTLTWDVREDERHEMFVEEVLPTDEEVRWNADRWVIMQLEEAGDDMETPREISHVAYFKTAERAEAFAAWAQEEGFTLGSVEPEDDVVRVNFSHISPPDMDEIFERTMASTMAAEEIGEGWYDGWECELVRAELS